MKKRIFGLVPNVFFLGLVSLWNDFSGEMVVAVMPAFLISLGAAPVFIGFLEGFADGLASVLKVFSGWLSDRIKRRKIISVFGYSLSVATRSGLAAIGNVWQAFGLRAVDRVGKGFRDSPRDALLAESVERYEVGRSFGYQRAMDALGGILGPVAAVALLPILHNDYRTLFVIAFGVGILAVLSFVFVKETPKEKIESEGPPRAFTFSMKAFPSQFRSYVAAIFIFGLGAFPVSLMLLRSGAIGELGEVIPLMYLVYNIAFTVCAIPFGKLADKIGEKQVITGGFFAAIASYLILAISTNAPGITLGFIFFGIYSAMTNGVQRSLASKLAGDSARATAQGFLGMATGLSSLIAGVGGGLLWTFFDAKTALVAGALLMTVGLIIFVRLNGFRRTEYNN